MPRRVGRPGLVGTMARTAAIAGTANAVNRSMSRRAMARDQQAMGAQAYPVKQAPPPAAPAPAPAAAPASGDDFMAQLGQLAQLHEAGVLSDDEFAAAKAKLLS